MLTLQIDDKAMEKGHLFVQMQWKNFFSFDCSFNIVFFKKTKLFCFWAGPGYMYGLIVVYIVSVQR